MGLASHSLHTSPETAAGEICGSAGLPMPKSKLGAKLVGTDMATPCDRMPVTLHPKTHLLLGQGKVLGHEGVADYNRN